MYEQLIRSLTDSEMTDGDPQMMTPGLREQEAASTGLAMSLSRNSGRELLAGGRVCRGAVTM